MAEVRKLKFTSTGKVIRRPPIALPKRKLFTGTRKAKIQTALSEDHKKALQLESLIKSITAEINSIQDPELKEQYFEAITNVAKDGDLQHMADLTKYRRKMVDLDTFLFDGTYLGLDEKELYPGVIEALHELDTDQYVEAVFKGAIGGGKSTVANIGIARSLYKLSCLRNVQETFGVQQHSSIVFTIQSVRLSTAKRAVFEEMGKYINNSPYFNEVYRYDKRITSSMIFRENGVVVLPVSSSDTGAISMNVVGGILDEMNFMQKVQKSKHSGADEEGVYDQATALYEVLSRRRRSRFMHKGNLPGMLYLISSSRYPDDFTEVKAKEAASCGGPDPKIYVWSKSLWESKGRDRYLPENFRVLIGDERSQSRILADDEQVQANAEILEVPEDFRSEFMKDVNAAIRDFGGRTTLASRPFILNRESLFECMALADQYDYRSVIALEDVELSVSIPTAIETRVRSDVKQMRVAHVDLAVTRDSAGLAIGHIAGTKTCERRDPETGKVEVEVLPVIAYDLILRIMPPRNGEIDFSKIRKILYDLRDNYGMPIKVVSTDGFQSVDFRQILAKKGFATEYISVDKTMEPYKTFRDALYDNRVILPRHQHLIHELTELEYVRQGAHEKVDHKPRGSKDVADACAAVASYLLTRRAAWTTQPIYQAQHGMLLHGNRTSHEKVFLEKMDDATLDTIYINGRAVIQRAKTQRAGGIVRRKNV